MCSSLKNLSVRNEKKIITRGPSHLTRRLVNSRSEIRANNFIVRVNLEHLHKVVSLTTSLYNGPLSTLLVIYIQENSDAK